LIIFLWIFGQNLFTFLLCEQFTNKIGELLKLVSLLRANASKIKTLKAKGQGALAPTLFVLMTKSISLAA